MRSYAASIVRSGQWWTKSGGGKWLNHTGGAN